jgi:RNA polymerase sigma-70 factor (ECF subfamily)
MELIYKEHARTVYRYMLSLTSDESLAEELTQETFYRAVYSIEKYDGKCKISVWLCQIAKHIWYQELEKKAKYKTQELNEDIPAHFSLEDTVVSSSEKIALYKAIKTLSEPMKEVVLLRLSGELSFAEIGEILSKSENWARTTFYRAKQKIKEVL